MTQESAQLPHLSPDLRLFGRVSNLMLAEFFRQQAEAPAQGPIVVELHTSGGDADFGRRIAQELRLWQEQEGREVWFLGKTCVLSAGVTIMAAVPRERRVLSNDCELLIHERKLKREISLNGSLRSSRSLLQDVLAEIESGERLERAGFSLLVQGTHLSVEEVAQRVLDKDWYLDAAEALHIGLVAGVI